MIAHLLAGLLSALLQAPPAGGEVQAPPAAAASEVEIEAEVVANIRAQPLGTGTVADLALPDEFLVRVADRIVRTSYAERYRVVVPDAAIEDARKQYEAQQKSEEGEPAPAAAPDPAPAAEPPSGAAPAPESRSGRGKIALALSVLALALFGGIAVIVARSSRRSAA